MGINGGSFTKTGISGSVSTLLSEEVSEGNRFVRDTFNPSFIETRMSPAEYPYKRVGLSAADVQPAAETQFGTNVWPCLGTIPTAILWSRQRGIPALYLRIKSPAISFRFWLCGNGVYQSVGIELPTTGDPSGIIWLSAADELTALDILEHDMPFRRIIRTIRTQQARIT